MAEEPRTATRLESVPRDPAMVERFLADTRFAPLWLGLRVVVGWFWLEAGWLRLNGDVAAGIDSLRDPLAIGLTLAGIAVILGALTGPAAFAGGDRLRRGRGVDHGLEDGGLDRWLLPLLGMPWRGGALFGERQTRDQEHRIGRQS